MAKKKSHINKYLKVNDSRTEKKVVSTRVSTAVADAFTNAVKLAESHGARLQLTDVVETALRDAIAEVSNAYDVDCYSEQLDLINNNDEAE